MRLPISRFLPLFVLVTIAAPVVFAAEVIGAAAGSTNQSQAPGSIKNLDVLGDLITLLVSGNQTNGAFTVLSETSPPGGGTPLHTHHNEDEALYVLQGEYEIQCGEQTVRAGAGAFVFAPREIPHKLTNVSSGPSTVLGIVSPAGFEGFWEEVSQLPPPPDIDQILAIAKKYRLEIHTP